MPVGHKGFPSGDLNPSKQRSIYIKKHALDVMWLSRRYTKEAVRTLVDIMRDKSSDPHNRLRAAECLINRGWGSYDKPFDVLKGVGQEQLAAIIKEIKLKHPEPLPRIMVHSEKTVIQGGRITTEHKQLDDGGHDDAIIAEKEDKT